MSTSTSFERGLAVLRELLRHPARADELSERRGMPLSSVYRYLKALREAGLVTEERGRYCATAVGWTEPPADTSARKLSLRARPLLEQLSTATGETALLTARAGAQAVCLAQVAATHSPCNVFPLHQPLPIHAGASKRVLLAYSSEPLRRHVLNAPLEQFTPVSPDARALEELLAHTRRRGAAVSHGEFIPGSLAVAVPVWRAEQLVGAMAVSGRQSRCDEQWAELALRELQRASAQLQATL